MLWLEIPAYAGSTRTSATPTGTAPDHPRIRGEHKLTATVEQLRGGSSPHTRGAQVRALPRHVQYGIIPAYAGSTPAGRFWCRRGRDHPRIRGEHAKTMPVTIRAFGSSPHTRGARRPDSRQDRGSRIIPAYAGSTKTATAPGRGRPDHPRIRGEHLNTRMLSPGGVGSSPHTRGAQPAARPQGGLHGIIPAYAGSTGSVYLEHHAASDHPRIRGEH